MKRQQQNYSPFGAIFPGQRETRRADEKTDYTLILKQWRGTIVLMVLSFLLVIANVLIIGPSLGYVVGIAAFIYVALWLRALTMNAPHDGIIAVGILIGIAMILVWLVFGYEMVELVWWDVRSDWEPRNKLLVIAFSGLFLSLTFLPIYRFAQEIVDPNWSPTISIRPAEWGPMWPFKNIPMDGEAEVRVVERDVIREVPRPYSIGARSTQVVTDDLDASRVDENKTVQAPSGREVTVRDLVDFVKLGAISGATFRKGGWKNRGWKHDRWKDVIEVWKIYGVVNANGERSTTQLVVTDLREVLTRLSSAFDPPTLP